MQIAVGNKGTILRYINNAWVKVASGTTADLQGVAAVSDSLAFIVGAKVNCASNSCTDEHSCEKVYFTMCSTDNM
jgi:hypothetical protein